MAFTPRNMRLGSPGPLSAREQRLREQMEKIEERIAHWMNARVAAEEKMADLLKLKARLGLDESAVNNEET